MRTTLDLPDELLKRAKILAVERGTTLKELMGSALRREVGLAKPETKSRRVEFPIFKSKNPGTLKIDNQTLSKLEAEEDARRHGMST